MAHLLVPQINKDGCEAWISDDFNNQTDFKSEPFFVMVHRGGCSFSSKYKNAQSFGASMLVVADYKLTEVAGDKSNSIDEQDGELLSHIPVFEISYEHA